MNTANLTSKYNSLSFLPPEFMIIALWKADRLPLSEGHITVCKYRISDPINIVIPDLSTTNFF